MGRDADFFAAPGRHTDPAAHVTHARDLGAEPQELARIVNQLLVHRDAVEAVCGSLPAERFESIQVRDAATMIDRIFALNASPLAVPRDPADRMVGVCYHAAVLLCALLRCNGIAARARCGFAGYFQQGLWLDHWITERWDGERWVADDPDAGLFDIQRGVGPGSNRFLSGGEAWQWCRSAGVDPDTFGVAGYTFGLPEVAGNAVRDLAALNKVEMLPWDNWGRMDDCYDGRTDEQYANGLDELAAVTTSDRSELMIALYDRVDDYRPDLPTATATEV